MWLKQTSAPSGELITLAEAKTHLGVDQAHHDAFINGLIAAAVQHLDGRRGYLGRCLLTQSWEYRVHCFPRCGVIELPLPPLQTVEIVKYLDDAGAEQTLAEDQYVVDAETYTGQIRRAYNVVWPFARLEDYAVRLTFTAGFGTAADVPEPIKKAMLLMVGHLYEHREEVVDGNLAEIAMGARWLLGPYRLDVL